VKILARKKREEGGGNNAPWLNTFADLMNLLLCFFVMLFAMSDVSEEKFDQISVSMANSIGIFDSGGSSVGSGNLISSGMTQMNELDKFYTNMGKASKQTGKDVQAEENNTTKEESNLSNEGSEAMNGEKGIKDNKGNSGIQDNQKNDNIQDSNSSQGSEGSQDTAGLGDAKLAEAMDTIEEKMQEVSTGMYDQVSELTQKYNLGDYVELSIDPEYQYVELTLKGSILYDSGDAKLKNTSLPILANIGDILKKFEGYTVEITGHTDNVPINSSQYKDNNWLSSARALNAADYLINKCKLDPAFIKYSGRGEYEPIASNATAEGRAKNRRIEIKIFNEYSGK
jgi:chemotaxis protein MotB